MAIVTDDLLALTLAGVKTDFDLAYYQAQPNMDWSKIATEIDTTLPIQNYSFLGRGMVIEKFIDRVREQGITPQAYLIKDEVYKGAIKVERTILEDDQYGLLKRRIDDAGEEANRFLERETFRRLGLGFSTLCVDGQYFFDTDHPAAGGGTYTNTTSATLSDASLDAAQAAMGLFTDDKNEPLGVIPDTLVVGPALQRKAWDLVGSPIIVAPVGSGTAGTGATASTPYGNFFQGRYNLLVSPYIRGFNWFLMDTKRSVKPLIVQNRIDIPTTIESDMMDGGAKIRDEYNFTVRLRKGFGYGLPQFAYGSSANS